MPMRQGVRNKANEEMRYASLRADPAIGDNLLNTRVISSTGGKPAGSRRGSRATSRAAFRSRPSRFCNAGLSLVHLGPHHLPVGSVARSWEEHQSGCYAARFRIPRPGRPSERIRSIGSSTGVA